MIVISSNFQKNYLDITYKRLARPQPRPILNRNGTKARYPDSFYEYYDFTRSLFNSVANKVEPFDSYPVGIYITFYFQPDSKNFCDIDNLAKPILDAITNAKIIKDDNINFVSKLNCEVKRDSEIDKIKVVIK